MVASGWEEGRKESELGNRYTEHFSYIYIFYLKKGTGGTSLTAQWLRLFASTAGSSSSILSQGTKIPHAS